MNEIGDWVKAVVNNTCKKFSFFDWIRNRRSRYTDHYGFHIIEGAD